MNVFEDLLVDLREQNLLEDTVLDGYPDAPEEIPEKQDELTEDPQTEIEALSTGDDHGAELVEIPAEEPTPSDGVLLKKRAISEVSGLQMVEHVLTGVEREYLKIKPRIFDDLKTKLALNRFLQAADGAGDDEEQRAADLGLMRETEAWCAALAARDKQVGVGYLRQYCENTKPALSSQALVALCRFYRNLPYTEGVRSKFDFLVTRLFSRALPNNERICLFKRDEAQKHLENLYREWSSVPLYSADSDESKIMLTALSFDELAEESEQAANFDILIESDFFPRLRMFKESIAELFFAPSVTIAALEANVRIGNSYVKLIAAERQKMDGDSIQAKYASIDHESFSDVTARTLDMLRATPAAMPEMPQQQAEASTERIEFSFDAHKSKISGKESSDDSDGSSGSKKGFIKKALSVNPWLLTFALVMIAASVGVYVWANYYAEETVPSSGVRAISVEAPVFNEYLKTAKISNETFYGVLKENWDGLNKERRTDYVQRLLAKGAEHGYTQVSLVTSEGRRAAYASRKRSEIQIQ